MTYEEIKSKLTKCEKKLKELQASSSKPKNYEQSVSKLNILKESLEKQLKEAEKGIVYTDDEEKAKDLADDGTNVKLTKESEFQGKYQFDVNETKAIAKKVGKAVAKAVKELSSDVKHMKAVNIKPDSFNIRIIFKNGSDDEFKFFIEDDTLHLADFSYDKELVGVGVKPDGEAIVHVEHLANELIKVLKEKMYEGMSDQEFADAKEKDRLEKHPEKEKIKAIQALIRNANKNEGEYAAGKGQLNVYGYQTKHFDICPGAVSLFKRVLKEKGKDEDDVKDLAIHHDYLFLLEKIALDMEVGKKYDSIKAVLKRTGEEGKAKRDHFLKRAIQVASDIYELGNKIGIDQNTDLSYIQNHLEKINDALREDDVNEAPDNKYYIKVRRNDKGSQNALQDAMETFHHPFRFTDIEDDRKDNYVTFYFNKKDWNPGMKDDIEGNGVNVIDTNIPDFHEDIKENQPTAFDEGQDDLFTFGYNLDMIQAVVDHLKSKYKEGQDFELHIGRGDDLPNAVTLKNPALQKDHDLIDKLNAAQGDENSDVDVNENQPTAFDDESMDALRDIILKYVEDPDAAERLVQQVDDKGLDSLPDDIEAQLERDVDFKKWYDNLHSAADTDYTRRRREEDDYYDADQAQKDDEEEYERGYDDDGLPLGEDALGFSDIEKLGSKAASDIDISVRRDPNYTFGKRPGDDARLRYKYAKQLGYLRENEVEDQKGDLDVGHQDDEPSMLKSTSYEAATYAAKLYKKLAKYDQFDGEVDFPNWWQSKLILAKDYLSKAFHYLDSEEKQPMIDKLALEGIVKEEDRDNPYTDYRDNSDGMWDAPKDFVHNIWRVVSIFGIGSETKKKNKAELIDAIEKFGYKYEVWKNKEIYYYVDGRTRPKKEDAEKIGQIRDKHLEQEQADFIAKRKSSKKVKPQKLSKLTKGGNTYKVGEDDPNDDGTITSIEKYPNGYFINGVVYGDDDGDKYEKEGYGYAIDLDGNEMDEDDLEGMFEGKYKSDAQRKAIHAKKAEMNEASYDDAISELRDIVDRAEDLGQEAREIVRQYFRSDYSRLDGYGAFNFVYSSNRYDTTLGKYVDRLEEEGYDDEFDEAELTDKEKKALKDMSKSLKGSSKGHGQQAKYLDKLVKEREGNNHPDFTDMATLDNGMLYVDDENMDTGEPTKPGSIVAIDGSLYVVTNIEKGDNYLVVKAPNGATNLEEGQAAIKKQLDKINQALKQHKDKTVAIVRKDIKQRTEDEKAHLAKMANLTKKKKDLLDKYGDAVAGINKGQELDA